MGCNTSNPEPQVANSTRRQSEVLVGVHVRAEAAHRRQRMARDMEQTVALRAHLEVEKAKIRKSSIDCGRTSRPLTSVYEEPEPEKADGKEIEEEKQTHIIRPSGEKEKIEESLDEQLSHVALGENRAANSEVENGTIELKDPETQKRVDEETRDSPNTGDEEKATGKGTNSNQEQRESINNNEVENTPQINQDPLSSYRAEEGKASPGTGEETKPAATEQLSQDHEQHSEVTESHDMSALDRVEFSETDKECTKSPEDDRETDAITGPENMEIVPDKELQLDGSTISYEQQKLAGGEARVNGPPKLPETAIDSSHENKGLS